MNVVCLQSVNDLVLIYFRIVINCTNVGLNGRKAEQAQTGRTDSITHILQHHCTWLPI